MHFKFTEQINQDLENSEILPELWLSFLIEHSSHTAKSAKSVCRGDMDSDLSSGFDFFNFF